MILNSCATSIELSFINRNIIGGGFLFAMIMKNLLIHNHSLKNESLPSWFSATVEFNCSAFYHTSISFVSSLFFFCIFVRIWLKLPQFWWWIWCSSRGWKSCRTDILLRGRFINRKCVTLRWWRFTGMVAIWETMWFRWLKWKTRETSWCVLLLVDSLFIKYIRKGKILYHFWFYTGLTVFLRKRQKACNCSKFNNLHSIHVCGRYLGFLKRN